MKFRIIIREDLEDGGDNASYPPFYGSNCMTKLPVVSGKQVILITTPRRSAEVECAVSTFDFWRFLDSFGECIYSSKYAEKTT